MMWKRIFSVVAPAACLVLTGYGQAVALNPLVEDEDAVSEPAIVGTWQDTDGSLAFVVRQTGPAEYEIGFGKENDDGAWRMRLIRINGELLADLSSKPPAHTLLVPVHIFVRVRLGQDWLRVAFFREQWLQDQIKGPGGPAYAVVDGDVILTGSTAELQDFVGGYIHAAQAFDEEDEFRRVEDAEKKPE